MNIINPGDIYIDTFHRIVYLIIQTDHNTSSMISTDNIFKTNMLETKNTEFVTRIFSELYSTC